jgi:hypothetical protein
MILKCQKSDAAAANVLILEKKQMPHDIFKISMKTI